MADEEGAATIVVPGPELRSKIDLLAARLSLIDKQAAENSISKLLSSAKRDQVLFLDPSHILYPYFLSKLTELRAKPASEREAEKTAAASSASSKDAGSASGTSGASANTSTTTTGGITRTVGGTVKLDPKREAALHQAEEEARRYMTDPFPDVFSLDLKDSTVDLPPFIFDVMSIAAQYTAKYGPTFLASVMARQRTNAVFRFLLAEDSRHDTFEKLVESYKRVLHFDPDETEERLEKMESTEYILDTVVAEKSKFAKAAIARRKAALLTDDQLRAKLHWGSFKVIKTFTLSDLSLDGAVPETATSRRHERQAAAAAAAMSKAAKSMTGGTIPPPASSNYLRPPSAVAAAAAAAPRGPPMPPPPRPPIAGSPPKPPIAGNGFVRPGKAAPKPAAATGSAEDAPAPPGPTFMSPELVHATETTSGHKRDREDESESHPDPTGTHVTESYVPRGAAPVHHATELFVDAVTGEQVHVEALQGSEIGRSQSDGAGAPKYSRAELGLASEDDLAKEIRRHHEQKDE